MNTEIKTFFDANTYTLTYVVSDPDTRDAVVIDPVLDLDTLAWRIHTTSADEVAGYVKENGLQVHWILDTHAHADHLTGMEVLKERLSAKGAIGSEITAVQQLFRDVFDLPEDFPTDGSQWDALLADGEVVQAGSLKIETLHTPGHTPACVTYKIGDALFTGDAIFMPDQGTGRCDFPKGSAEDLYDSITQKIYSQPDSTRIFVGHDYQPGGRELAWETTVGEQKQRNIQLTGATAREQFIELRTARDAKLSPPRLILQSLQVNLDAGKLPEASGNGRRYLQMPLNFLGQ